MQKRHGCEPCLKIYLSSIFLPAGETVDELRNIIEGMMDQKMIQMFIDEQKRKLEERERLLSEKDEEIRQLKARIAQLEGK